MSAYENDENLHGKFLTAMAIQDTVYPTLAGTGYLNKELLDKGIIAPSRKGVPQAVQERLADFLSRENELCSFLFEEFAKLSLFGPAGLKARSGLLEYRYDPE